MFLFKTIDIIFNKTPVTNKFR